MDLQEVWKKLETDKLNKPVLGAVEVRKTSRHPVQKLKNAYRISVGFAVVFLVGFVFLFFQFPQPLVRGGLALVILSYIFFLVTNVSMVRKIKVDLPVDGSLKAALSYTYDFISSNIRFQERVALYIYPIAGTAGFLMGGTMAGADMGKLMMQKVIVVVILIVTLLILSPVCYYLAKWMNRLYFGKHLIELKQSIDEMERPD